MSRQKQILVCYVCQNLMKPRILPETTFTTLSWLPEAADLVVGNFVLRFLTANRLIRNEEYFCLKNKYLQPPAPAAVLQQIYC